MFVHIFFFVWHPPNLSEESKLWFGEQVNRLGKEHFLWQFRKWVGSNPSSPPHPDSVKLDFEDGPPKLRLDGFFSKVRCITSPYEFLIAAVYFLFCFGAVLYVGDFHLLYYLWGLGLLFWGIWLLSLFLGFRKYRK